MGVRWNAGIALVGLALAACASSSTGPSEPEAVLLAAGDIADCGSNGDEQTADLIERIPGTVAAVGDDAYGDGSPDQFADCYAPSWGRFQDRTRPAPGNHEYLTEGAYAYFDFFGDAAGPWGKGYYSYDDGPWHVVSLNSNVDDIDADAQEQWLADDLDAHPSACTVAYFHHPRFSSGQHGDQEQVLPIWRILQDHGVDVVISGHDHDYERFRPQTPDGDADDEGGIREFVVGTGGVGLRDFGEVRPNSEFRYNSSFGVLELGLYADGYRWSYLRAPDGQSIDSGEGRCH